MKFSQVLGPLRDFDLVGVQIHVSTENLSTLESTAKNAGFEVSFVRRWQGGATVFLRVATSARKAPEGSSFVAVGYAPGAFTCGQCHAHKARGLVYQCGGAFLCSRACVEGYQGAAQ